MVAPPPPVATVAAVAISKDPLWLLPFVGLVLPTGFF